MADTNYQLTYYRHIIIIILLGWQAIDLNIHLAWKARWMLLIDGAFFIMHG